jgi:hypothetical protein
MTFSRSLLAAALVLASLSLASTCNVYVEEEGEPRAYRDESRTEQMQDEAMEEVEEQINE